MWRYAEFSIPPEFYEIRYPSKLSVFMIELKLYYKLNQSIKDNSFMINKDNLSESSFFFLV
jgi:hypothetical protein